VVGVAYYETTKAMMHDVISMTSDLVSSGLHWYTWGRGLIKLHHPAMSCIIKERPKGRQLVSYKPGVLAKVFSVVLTICLGSEEKGMVKRNDSTEGNLKQHVGEMG